MQEYVNKVTIQNKLSLYFLYSHNEGNETWDFFKIPNKF